MRTPGAAGAATSTGVDVAAIIRDHDVRLVYQPIVDLGSDAVVAVEALARFPSHGSPLTVFRAAEEANRAADLEALVLTRALNERLRVPTGLLLTLNVTPEHLLAGPVRDVLAAEGLRGLVFELTEQAMPPDTTAFGPALDGLRDRGALIALDDTGAGYQGLQQMAALRPDWVKIDRAIVTDAADDEVRQASLAMFTRVARRVGATAVAEGVESARDVAVLEEAGVTLAQGYYLGAPTPHPHVRQQQV